MGACCDCTGVCTGSPPLAGPVVAHRFATLATLILFAHMLISTDCSWICGAVWTRVACNVLDTQKEALELDCCSLRPTSFSPWSNPMAK